MLIRKALFSEKSKRTKTAELLDLKTISPKTFRRVLTNSLNEKKLFDPGVPPLLQGDLRNLGSMRNLLYTEWASVSKCFHYQPLDYIKEYFGVKIGLYFAWLGFYTHMLIPASVVGLLCFLYSCLTLFSNEPSEEICSGNTSFKMCPLCDGLCGYWDLKETCLHARITYLFDNPSTVFFATFMSFWATLFLELWKRYSAEITHRWDLTGFDIQEEHPRPQYLARLAHVKKKSANAITVIEEPSVPFWKMKLPAILFSFSVVLLLIAVAMAAVLAVVLYRISVLAALSVYNDQVITSYAILFTTATAACINLCCIFLFNWVYVWLAEYLTEVEFLRTQTEFDDSLTLKIYLLQFINYYASIFYIAFFKGKFTGFPGKYRRFLKYRQEECGPGGCLMELCIQLSIIMVGKQAMTTVMEMLLPLFYKWLNTLKVHVGSEKCENRRGSACKMSLQWLRDYKLVEWGPRSLFPEYLEMVLQYGFVTIFVAAFPLAPFFALINNILEMRLDAKKLLIMYRRPVGQRVRDIGIWYRILDSVSKLSVITNGFIIAFTSNFIPRQVHLMAVSKNYSLHGFLKDSLSEFRVEDWPPIMRPNVTQPVEICYYPDYRAPPTATNKYEHTSMYWHILAARLAFVVVFENVVAMVMIVLRWCIPNVPQKLRDQIRREAYITNEIIIKQEAMRACMPRTSDDNTSQSIPPNENAETLGREPQAPGKFGTQSYDQGTSTTQRQDHFRKEHSAYFDRERDSLQRKSVSGEPRRVDLHSVKARVDKVHVDGLMRTKDDIVKAQVTELFKAKDFEDVIVRADKVREKLVALGCFKNIGVYIDVSNGPGSTPEGVEVTYTVREVKRITGEINTMVGNNEGSLIIGARAPNIFGRGEQLQMEYSYGNKNSTNVNISAVKPFVDSRLHKVLTASVFSTMSDLPWSGYKERDRGLLLDLALNPGGNGTLKHKFQYEGTYRDLSASKQVSFKVREQAGPSLKSALRHICSIDKRDGSIFPTNGSLIQFTTEVAGLGGNIGFVKNEFVMQSNWSPHEFATFQLGFQSGLLRGISNDMQISICDHFFLGGPLNLRGFDMRGCGPRHEGNSIGGDVYWALALHLYTPLPFRPGKNSFGDLFRLHGFINGGNLTNFDFKFDGDFKENLKMFTHNVRCSTGAGIAMKLGNIARVELNLILPLMFARSDLLQQMQFGIGLYYL